MNETELSKHVWNLKDHGLDNNLSWEIHKKASPYHCGSKRCDLCLSEKVSIISADQDTLLKKRTEYGMVFNYVPQFLYKDTEQN